LVEIGTALVADPQPFELMEPGEYALDYPPGAPKARAVCDPASGDDGLDPARPQQAAVLVEVVAAVGVQPFGPIAGATAQSPDTWDRFQ
jgi:hypothetical protein